MNASVPLSARFGTASDLVEVLAVLSMQVSGDGSAWARPARHMPGRDAALPRSPTEAEAI